MNMGALKAIPKSSAVLLFLVVVVTAAWAQDSELGGGLLPDYCFKHKDVQ